MGMSYGRAWTSATYAAELAKRLRRAGADSSTGATQLLAYMDVGVDDLTLAPELAGQAARSLRAAAGRLGRTDRAVAQQIADDADAAQRAGRHWYIT